MKHLCRYHAATASLLLIAASTTALAEAPSARVAPGYLSSGFGIPVKNSYGECWLSGPVPDFKPSPDCTIQAAPVIQEKVAAPVVAPEPEVKATESAPAPAPAPVPAEPIHVSLSADALFDFDKSKLRPAGMKAIEEVLAKTMLEGGAINVDHIHVVGHTDSVGTVAYNQKLSERRAESVKTFLISKGIKAETIMTEGKGKLEPIATNKTAAGRQLNRRVDITFEGTEPAK